MREIVPLDDALEELDNETCVGSHGGCRWNEDLPGSVYPGEEFLAVDDDGVDDRLNASVLEVLGRVGGRKLERIRRGFGLFLGLARGIRHGKVGGESRAILLRDATERCNFRDGESLGRDVGVGRPPVFLVQNLLESVADARLEPDPGLGCAQPRDKHPMESGAIFYTLSEDVIKNLSRLEQIRKPCHLEVLRLDSRCLWMKLRCFWT